MPFSRQLNMILKNKAMLLLVIWLWSLNLFLSGQVPRYTIVNGVTIKSGDKDISNIRSKIFKPELFKKLSTQRDNGECNRINDISDTFGSAQYLPSMAVGKDGLIIAVWVDNRDGGDDIYAQCLDKNGLKVGDNFKVNELRNSLRDFKPTIDANAEGEFLIVWADKESRILAQKVLPSGKPSGSNIVLRNNYFRVVVSPPLIKYNNKGNFIVVSSTNSIQAVLYDRLGNKISEELNINYISSYGALINVAADLNNNFRVVYSKNVEGGSQIFMQTISSEGRLMDDEKWVSTSDWDKACYYAEIFSNINGNMCVVWESQLSPTNFTHVKKCQLLNADGSFIGENIAVNSESNLYNNAKVAGNNEGGFTLALTGWSNIEITRVSHQGKIIDNYTTQMQSPYGVITDGMIAYGVDGKLLLTWSDARNIIENVYWGRISSDFTKIENERSLPEDTGSAFQTKPQLAIQPDGKMMAIWSDEREGDTKLFGSLISPEGIPIGNNLKISQRWISTYYLSPPFRIKPDKKNNFIVLYVDVNNEVYLKKLDCNGLQLAEYKIIDYSILDVYGNMDLYIDDNNNIIVCCEGSKLITSDKTARGLLLRVYSENLNYSNIEYFYPGSSESGQNYGAILDFTVNNKSELLLIYQNSVTTASGLAPADYISCIVYNYSAKALNTPRVLVRDIKDRIYKINSIAGNEGQFIVCLRESGNNEPSVNIKIVDLESNGAISSYTLDQSDNSEYGDVSLIKDEQDNLVLINRHLGKMYAYRINKSYEPISDPQLLIEQNIGEHSAFAYRNGRIYSVFDDAIQDKTGMDVYMSVFHGYEKFMSKDPENIILYSNYPNPFNAVTNITYSLPYPARVRIRIFNSIGQQIAEPINKEQGSGYYKLVFNAGNLPSGIYFYQIETPYASKANKMIILK